MFSFNPIYPLSSQGALFAHTSGNHNNISRYKSNAFKLTGFNRQDKISFGTMSSPNISSLTMLIEKSSYKLGSIGKNWSPLAVLSPNILGLTIMPNKTSLLPLANRCFKQSLHSVIIHRLLLY